MLFIRKIESSGDLVYRSHKVENYFVVNILNANNLSIIGEFHEFNHENNLIRHVDSWYLTLNKDGSDFDKLKLLIIFQH